MGNERKNGRPKIDIDWKKFDSFCAVQCTLREVAEYFNCSEDTIERRVKEHYNCGFAEIFKRRRVVGLISLRRNMFKLSETHPAMAIFLAKNWLAMSDKHEVELSDAAVKPLEEYSTDELLAIIESGQRGTKT